MTTTDESKPVNPFGEQYAIPERPESDGDKIEYDRWGRYANLPGMPGEFGPMPWTRASTIAGTLPDKYHLELWKQRQVVRGLVAKPGLLELVNGPRFNHETKHGKDLLNSVAYTAMEEAGSHDGAKAGTKFHDLAERIDRGEGLLLDPDLPADDLAMLEAYERVMREHAIKPIAEFMERVICVPSLGVAGRLDRIYNDNGVLRIGDLKSQKWEPGLFDSISLSVQLAIYSNAEFMLDMSVKPWKWVPMPKLDKLNGLCLWVPAVEPGRAEVHDVDLAFGWKLAKASAKTREWRKAKGVVSRRVVR